MLRLRRGALCNVFKSGRDNLSGKECSLSLSLSLDALTLFNFHLASKKT